MAFKTENYNLPLVDSKMIANGPQAINNLAQSVDEQFKKTEELIDTAVNNIVVPSYDLPVASANVLGGIRADVSSERTSVSNVYRNKDYKMFVPLATIDSATFASRVPPNSYAGAVVVSGQVDSVCPIVIDTDTKHGIPYVSNGSNGGAITEPKEASGLIVDGTSLKVSGVTEDNLAPELNDKIADPYSLGTDNESTGSAFQYLKEAYALVGLNYSDDKYDPVETSSGKVSVVKFLPGVFCFQVNVSFKLSSESKDSEAALFECGSNTHAIELASILSGYFASFAKKESGEYDHVQTKLQADGSTVYLKLSDYVSDYTEITVTGSAVVTM
jgi:hypothetical protein